MFAYKTFFIVNFKKTNKAFFIFCDMHKNIYKGIKKASSNFLHLKFFSESER